MELQWPLIIFTTLVAWSAGLFASQCVLAFQGGARKTQMTSWIVAAVLLVVGGIAVFLHLEHWERIFNGFGHLTSGITQELIAIVALAVVALVYLVMLRRSADETVPQWLAVVGVAVSVVLVAVMAHSYLMPARPAWDTPLWILAVLGNACILGPATLVVLMAVKGDLGAGAAAVTTAAPRAAVAGGSTKPAGAGVKMASAGAAAAVLDDDADDVAVSTGSPARVIGASKAAAATAGPLAPALVVGGSLVNAVATLLYVAAAAMASSTFSNVGFYFDPTHPNKPMTDASLFGPFAGDNLLLVVLGVVVIGVVAPVACAFLGKRQGDWKVWGSVAALCALVGAVCLRIAFYNMGGSIFLLY